MADITYKKTVILLATAGGSGSYAIRQDGFLQIIMFFVFIFFGTGVIVNYLELNKNKKDLEEIKHG
jgi:preprotein translocase subunit SecG